MGSAYKVAAGYVTVETAVPGGRAYVDIPRGELLPGDVPDDQVVVLLGRGHLEPVGEDAGGGGKEPPTAPPDPDGQQSTQNPSDDPPGQPSAQDIREWARSVGLEVNDKGRVPAAVVEAYTAAHLPQQ
ncbi:MAG TPA: histone-like nucleoid-structuring protein Lsr2 [Mycobacteriales bacterium]|jgi:Lsr2.